MQSLWGKTYRFWDWGVYIQVWRTQWYGHFKRSLGPSWDHLKLLYTEPNGLCLSLTVLAFLLFCSLWPLRRVMWCRGVQFLEGQQSLTLPHSVPFQGNICTALFYLCICVVHSFTHSFMHPCIHAFVRSFTHACMHAFVHLIRSTGKPNVSRPWAFRWSMLRGVLFSFLPVLCCIRACKIQRKPQMRFTLVCM